MGYYASASSRLMLNDYGKQHLNEIEDIIDNDSNLEWAFDEIEIYSNDSIVVTKYQDNYHEDETINFLKVIHPYIRNGEAIEYLGEDGSEWRFMRSDDGWDDQNPTHVWKTVYTYKVKEV